MYSLRNYSIKQKLLIIIMLTSGMALLLTSVSVVFHDRGTSRNALVEELTAAAKMTGDNSSAALSFNDPASAETTLESLRAHPHIVVGAVYDANGKAFAKYQGAKVKEVFSTLPMEPEGHHFRNGHLELFHPIELAGENVGTVYLRSDLTHLRTRLWRYAAVVALVIVASSVAAFVFSMRLQAIISDPIKTLAEVARVVGKDKDYSIRAAKHGEDELGNLTDGFNEMLVQIQQQELSLREVSNKLEQRVEERTGELANANESLVQSEQRYRALFESSRDANMTLSPPDWRFSSANAATIALFRAKDENEFVSLGPWNVSPERQPDGELSSDKAKRMIGMAMEQGSHFFEWRHQRINDETFPSTVLLSRMEAAGKAFLQATVRDITEQKQAQAALAERATLDRLGLDVNRALALQEDMPVMLRDCCAALVRHLDAAFARIWTLQDGATILELQASAGLYTHTDGPHRQVPVGQFKIGLIAAEKQPHLTNSAIGDPRVHNQEWAKREGMVAFAGHPLMVKNRVVGVMAMFARHPFSELTLAALSLVANEIAFGIDRKRAEAALAEAQQQLVEASRQAGMAEVATSVLHNVGNVLNSVNVSLEAVTKKVRKFRVGNLKSVAELLREHAADLPEYLSRDPNGKELPDYLLKLVDHLGEPQHGALQELQALRKNIEHIKEIVAMQQRHARGSGVLESLSVTEVIEDAIRINAAGFNRHEVQLTREFSPVPPVLTDRHKVLQILVNLVGNAKYAMADVAGDKRLIVRVASNGTEGVKIEAVDNGVGIAPENLTKIFQHGFTTKKEGHGFGLHSGANAAKELGGSLSVHSDGVGQGAVFTLELPFQNKEQRL